jgi:hypothetical protein
MENRTSQFTARALATNNDHQTTDAEILKLTECSVWVVTEDTILVLSLSIIPTFIMAYCTANEKACFPS